ncbi:MAG: dTMP kinase [Myxococcota bacterium]
MTVWPNKGMFYAVEGIDGAGSSMQARLLYEHLIASGFSVYLTHEPSNGPVGQHLRRLLRGEGVSAMSPESMALLFAADRMQHAHLDIVPRLQRGDHVICDRYVLSSLVYQGLDLPLAWVEQINRHAPPPDVTILIDTPSPQAAQRRAQRGGPTEIFDSDTLQHRLRERYVALLPPDGIRLDGTAAPRAIFRQLLSRLQAKGLLPVPRARVPFSSPAASEQPAPMAT